MRSRDRPRLVPDGALDVTLPDAAWATTLVQPTDLAREDVADNLRRAIAAAGTTHRSAADAGVDIGPADPIGVAVLLAWAISAFARWVVRTADERSVAAATGSQATLRLLNESRREANLRANSLTIGCMGSIVAGVAALAISFLVSAAVAAAGAPAAVAGAFLVAPVAAAIVVLWSVRRRYPSPPQWGINRFAGRIFGILILAIIVAIVTFGWLVPTLLGSR